MSWLCWRAVWTLTFYIAVLTAFFSFLNFKCVGFLTRVYVVAYIVCNNNIKWSKWTQANVVSHSTLRETASWSMRTFCHTDHVTTWRRPTLYAVSCCSRAAPVNNRLLVVARRMSRVVSVVVHRWLTAVVASLRASIHASTQSAPLARYSLYRCTYCTQVYLLHRCIHCTDVPCGRVMRSLGLCDLAAK